MRNALRSFRASIENPSKIDPHGFRRAFGDANELQELSGIIRARLGTVPGASPGDFGAPRGLPGAFLERPGRVRSVPTASRLRPRPSPDCPRATRSRSGPPRTLRDRFWKEFSFIFAQFFVIFELCWACTLSELAIDDGTISASPKRGAYLGMCVV